MGRKFFICVLSQCLVYWINFQNIYTFPYQKHYFIYFSCIFWNIWKPSVYPWGIFRLILSYSAHCVALTCSQLCHLIPSPGIFGTGGIFKASYIQNPVIFRTFHLSICWYIHNLLIFSKLSKPCVTLEIQNQGILTMLEYLELWHT